MSICTEGRSISLDPVKDRTTDLTEGPIAPRLAAFAVPLLLGSMIQLLYSTVDMIFAGRAIGSEAAAAVGSSGLIVICMISLFSGIGSGAGVCAATSFGRRDMRELSVTVQTSAGISIAMAVGLTLAGEAAAHAILRAMDTPDAIIGDAVLYIRIYLLSLPSMIIFSIGSALLRAVGDSRSPMLCQLAGGIANVGGNALFICVLEMGVAGAALTSVVSQSAAAFFTVRRLCRETGGAPLRLESIRIDAAAARRIFGIGIPAAVQSLAVSLSNLFVQASINLLGVGSIAAFTSYFKAEALLFLPIIAMGQAAMTFTAQNAGAGREDRVRAGMRAALAISCGTTIAISCALLIARVQLIGVFTSDADVIALGAGIVVVTFPFYFLYAVMNVLASVLRGRGRAVLAMGAVIFSMCAARPLLIAAAMRLAPTASGVAAIYPLTWAIADICLALMNVCAMKSAAAAGS